MTLHSSSIIVVFTYCILLQTGKNYAQQLDSYGENFEIPDITPKRFFWGKPTGMESDYWGMEVVSPKRINFVKDSSGKQVVKITVVTKDGPGRTKYPRTRAEIKYFSPNHQTVGEFYYSWRFMIPNDAEFRDTIPLSTNGTIPYHFIAQWHDPIPKSKIDQDTFNTEVPIFLEYLHDTVSQNNQRTIRLKFRSTKQKHGYQIMEGAIRKGEWTKIILHINWAIDNTGYIEAWVNGEQLVEIRSGKTKMQGPNLKKLITGEIGSNYFKAGHYRSQFSNSHTIYFDDFSYGKNISDLIIQL